MRPGPEDEDQWEELGHGVSWAWLYHNDNKVGGYVRHPAQDGSGGPFDGMCCGAVTFQGPHAWNLVKEEPLTMEPSILCACGFHGWIRGGRWVPA